ncbi:hypothetical protein GCM10010404_23770 [Nonomuraea africana]
MSLTLRVGLLGPPLPKVSPAQMRTMLTSSYANYYRRMLPKLLAAIEFKCNNTAYRVLVKASR